MLQYTHHAKIRMAQRSISTDEIEYCLSNFYASYHDKGGNTIYVAYTQSKRRIKVVVSKDNSNIIITVGD
jgi:hypothetical protein